MIKFSLTETFGYRKMLTLDKVFWGENGQNLSAACSGTGLFSEEEHHCYSMELNNKHRRIWSDVVRLGRNVGYGRTWQDSVRLGRIRSDLVGTGQNRSVQVGFGWNLSDLVGICQIWSDLSESVGFVGICRIWSDLVGVCRIRSDLVGICQIQSELVGIGRIWCSPWEGTLMIRVLFGAITSGDNALFILRSS